MEKISYALLLCVGLHFSAQAQAPSAIVVRGPYIQLTTPTSTNIRWRSADPSAAVVKYGLTPTELNREATSSAMTVDHEVKLEGLAPDTRYFYSIGGTAGTVQGDEKNSFVTFPEQGKPRKTKIWVIGDAGQPTAIHNAVRDAFLTYNNQQDVDLWLMLGDNAYMSGQDAEYQVGLFNIYPDFGKRNAFFPTFGNHDSYGTSQVADIGPFFSNFTLPSAGEYGGEPSGTEKYYSFDYANIHFISLDANMTQMLINGDAMIQWLEADLQKNTQYWTVVYFHHPPYTKGSHDSDSEDELIYMRETVNPILEQYGVDLVMGGHSHCYERSFFLNGHYGNSETFDAAIHTKQAGNGMINGDGPYMKAAGANTGTVYVVAGSSCQIGGGSLDHKAMFKSLNEAGSFIIDVEGQELTGRFLNQAGEIKDDFAIRKSFVSSVNQVNSGINVSYYPNPASDNLTLSFNSPEKNAVRVELINALGQKVYIETLNDFSGDYSKTLPLNRLSKGMYTIKVKMGDKTFADKVSV